MRHPSTPAERVAWASVLLAREGEYGVVAALSRASGASRPTLYARRERARAALGAAFAPVVDPAPPPPAVARAALTLLVAGHASVRGIQACLRELWGQRRGSRECRFEQVRRRKAVLPRLLGISVAEPDGRRALLDTAWQIELWFYQKERRSARGRDRSWGESVPARSPDRGIRRSRAT
jgi:hypothetical protein